MAKFEDMAHIIAPYAPNIPAFTAGNALRDAARQYFREVYAYVVDDCLGLLPGLSTYDVDEPDYETEVVAIVSVERNEWDKLSPLSQPPTHRQDGQPRHFYGVSNGRMRFYPVPVNAETLQVSYAVRPTPTADEMDDRILAENLDALKYGALAIVKSQPNVDWSAPDEVPYFEKLFDQEINAKRIEKLTEEVSQQATMTINNFL